MSGTSLTIDKASLGLGSADNTSDLNKPLSKPLRDWLDRLSAKNHKHDWNGLGILPANHAAHGVTKYASTVGGLAQVKAVAPQFWSIWRRVQKRFELHCKTPTPALWLILQRSIPPYGALLPARWV